jgi:dihydrofolate synthase/folylpolyglutamate synthase
MYSYEDFQKHIYQRYSGNVKLGLERMLGILADMDEPNLKLKGIHVAGTNGKGSTSSACEALCLAHHFSTGLNTSPHLVDYAERFRLSGKNVNFEEILEIFATWEPVFEKWDASFFEITTAIAFWMFHIHHVHTAIFEVGLGGRLDGTNPFASSVCIITTISLDHPKSLGDTIEKIAFEKAGIIKPGIPVVLGPIVPAAMDVIMNVAREKAAPVYRLGHEFTIEQVSTGEKGTFFDYHFPELDVHIERLCSNLLGYYQAENAALALTAFLLYCKKYDYLWTDEQIRSALSHIQWQGRLQVFQQQPLVLLDGAHNDEGVDSLIRSLQEIFPHYKYRIVTAILRDKPFPSMLRKLSGIAEHIYITANHSERAAGILEEAQILKDCHASFEVSVDVISATKQAIADVQNGEMVIVCGSLHTVAEVLEYKGKF